LPAQFRELKHAEKAVQNIMTRKIKFRKIAIVIFLTVLIWVWQDLALDEELPVPNAAITIANPTSNLWVSFKNKKSVSIDNIVLKGPASKIAEVSRKLNDGSLEFNFSLNPEREGITTAGPRTLNVLDFIKRSDKIKELPGLSIESCEPEIIDVNVVELVEKQLDIEFFDESGAPLQVDSYEPAKVVMFVPDDRRMTARIQLTRTEIDQARLTPIQKTPYIVLAADQTRKAPKTQTVSIKLPPEADALREYPISGAKLGFSLSMNLLGDYDVEVTNYNDLATFPILATPEAKQAYENQPFQITLYILDEDAKKGPEQEQTRRVVYNFPQESIRRNEIKLKNPLQPAEARFKLIPLKSVKTPPAGVD
jgi:hypothetical protein